MPMIRAFIAMEMAPNVQQQLADWSSELKRCIPSGLVRWVPPATMHLTLKFLGDIPTQHLGAYRDMLDTVVPAYPAVQVTLGPLAAFPSLSKPRVLVVSLQAPPALALLQAQLEGGAVQLGCAPEERVFSPHLTLGRVSRDALPKDLPLISQALRSVLQSKQTTALIQAVHLFRSDLQPSGPMYTRLHSTNLSPAARNTIE